MYQFITGPLLWFALLFFFIGLIVNVVIYIRGLDWRLDRVTYTQNVSYGIRGALKSIIVWLVPFATRGWRKNIYYTVVFFLFHTGILITPLFLIAHNVILKERWGISLWTVSDKTSDILTIAVIVSAILLLVRRVSLPEVRIITRFNDLFLMGVSVLPFITGFFAYHQFRNPEFWLIVHILSGEVLLILIPITKLSHFVHFFCSRVQLGMDFGIKRGGMKSKGLNW